MKSIRFLSILISAAYINMSMTLNAAELLVNKTLTDKTPGSSPTKTVTSKRSNKKNSIDETVLGMNVSGNKELPNVLYIIPWKNNLIDPVDSIPVQNILLDEIFAPIDPEAFSKKVKFYHQITATQSKNK